MRIKYRRGKPPKFYYPDGRRFISKYERCFIIKPLVDKYIKDLESSKSLYTGINVIMKQDNPLDP